MDRDPRGGCNRKKINEDFFKVWTPNMAYVLGFIYADGALIDSNLSSRTRYLLLSNNDEDLLVKIKEALSSDHKLDYRPACKRIFGNGKEYYCKPSYRLRIGNKKIFDDLLRLGLSPRKSLTIDLPSVPTKLFAFFLRGYFDGDGCLNIYRDRKQLVVQIVFTSGSFVFLHKISRKISDTLGITPKNIGFHSNAYRLYYKAREPVSLCNFMYKKLTTTPYLNYKHEIFQNYCGAISEK